MSSKHRTHRMEKLARIYDAEIVPVWSQPFGQLLLRGLKVPEHSQILDVACGTGYPTTELIRLKDEDSRLIAIEASSALLDVARKKLEESGAKGVFLRSQAAEPRLKFADGVYDLVVCNVAVQNMKDRPAAIADFARVLRVGGELRVTLPLAGSFGEFFDIYREVLVKQDKHETAQRLRSYIDQRYPTAEACEQWLCDAGLDDVAVDIEEFTLLFRSSREFFFAPLIEFGPLAEWKAVAGSGQEMQDVFWFIKEAIDSYFDGRAFEVTIRAGLLRGRRRSAAIAASPAPAQGAVRTATGTGRADEPEPFADAEELDTASLELLSPTEAEAEVAHEVSEAQVVAEVAVMPLAARVAQPIGPDDAAPPIGPDDAASPIGPDDSLPAGRGERDEPATDFEDYLPSPPLAADAALTRPEEYLPEPRTGRAPTFRASSESDADSESDTDTDDAVSAALADLPHAHGDSVDIDFEPTVAPDDDD